MDLRGSENSSEPLFSFDEPEFLAFQSLLRKEARSLINFISPLSQISSHLFAGKMLRSRLSFYTGKTLNINEDTTLAVASSVELFHEASLCHDDIEDSQYLRRNRPSLWRILGLNQAINFGDLLQSVAYQPLLALQIKEAPLMIRHLNSVVSKTIRGQVMEQAKVGQLLSRSEYQEIASLKTGALLAAGPELLALAAGQTTVFQQLGEAFKHLGLAFQYRNDINGIFEKSHQLDLKNQISSLPMILLFEKKNIFNACLTQSEFFELTSTKIMSLFEEYQIEQAANELVARHLRLFLAEMQRIHPDWTSSHRALVHRLFPKFDVI